MLAIFVFFFLLASRAVYADFHFLSCVSTGPTASPIAANPTIAVPTSVMSSCAGLLGPRMVLLENLTQPVGQQDVFSIDGFCDSRRLDIRRASSDLLGIFYSGGDGTVLGQCSPVSPTNFSCVSQGLSLDCTDSWQCFSGICEAARENTTTQPFTPSALATPGSANIQPTISDSASHSRKHSLRTAIILAAVLSPTCVGLAIAIVLLLWRRRRRSREQTQAADDPPLTPRRRDGPVVPWISRTPAAVYGAAPAETPIATFRPAAVLATQPPRSTSLPVKTPGGMLTGPSTDPFSAGSQVEAVARRSSVVSDIQPPSYHRGDESDE